MGFAPVYSFPSPHAKWSDSECVSSWTPTCLKNVSMGIVSAPDAEAVTAPKEANSRTNSLDQGLAGRVTVIGLASFWEYLFGWDLDIHQALFGVNDHTAKQAKRDQFAGTIAKL